MSPNCIRTVACKDASISLLSSSVSYEDNVLGNKPHETVKCQFRVTSLNVIAGTISSYYVDKSRVVGDADSQSLLVIETVLGITSVTSVDKWIDVCLTKMTKSESATFSITSTKDDELRFLVSLELIDFEDNFQELFCRQPVELIEFAAQLKNDGVQLYKEKRISDAFNKFRDACKFLFFIDPRKAENPVLQSKDELLANLYNNLAGCHVSQENWLLAIQLCNSVLELEPQNIKARFRRGVSFLEIQEFDKAREDLTFVIEKEPNNSFVQRKLRTLDENERCLNKKYATAMKKMFS